MEKMRNTPLPPYNSFGEEEVRAAAEVVKTGLLSDYLGRHSEKFLGGKNVLRFEKAWAEHHQVKHAITFNTATSALVAALGAFGILPGDEVIVLPWGMCISATAPLFWDAIPVFVDIESTYFCLDPNRLEAAITPRTRAILTVEMFGQSSDMEAINKIARKHNLKVLCDTSHTPGTRYKGHFAGTLGDIGVFSLNQHKIIHCGEGGVAVTNDDETAHRLQLLRNHGEAVVAENGYQNLRNIVGGNYRLPEVESAIAYEQLKKLPRLLEDRVSLARYLTDYLKPLDFLTPPQVRENSEHAYYLFPIKFNERAAGLSRAEYVANINALGFPLYRLASGYVEPFYQLPIFKNKNEFKNGFPFNLLPAGSQPNYSLGACPVVESLHNKEMIVTAFNYPPLTKDDMRDVARAFEKAALMKSSRGIHP